MDQALKAKWVEALRSDEYEQGSGYLEDGGKLCCLGVLLKVQGEDVSSWSRNQKRTAKLPEGFRGGLTALQMGDLANRNDGINGYKQESFPKIADHIEQTL